MAGGEDASLEIGCSLSSGERGSWNGVPGNGVPGVGKCIESSGVGNVLNPCFSFLLLFSAGRPFLSVSFRFSSEVAPRNPGHATHFTKGNENPLGNKLGGGPGGGARTPPSVNFRHTPKKLGPKLP